MARLTEICSCNVYRAHINGTAFLLKDTLVTVEAVRQQLNDSRFTVVYAGNCRCLLDHIIYQFCINFDLFILYWLLIKLQDQNPNQNLRQNTVPKIPIASQEKFAISIPGPLFSEIVYLWDLTRSQVSYLDYVFCNTYLYNIGSKKNYQNVILLIVLQLTVNGQHGPNGVLVVLHVAWAGRQGAVTMVNKI